MVEGTAQSTTVERDLEDVRDKYGDHAQHYAETRAEAAQTAGADDDADHWQAVADRLDKDGE